MADSGRHLALIIPGLCGPDSDPPVSDYLQPRPAALDRLLSRSKIVQHGTTGLEATLCRWFGLDGNGQAALPVAPLTYRADAGETAAGYIMRADPVYLRADQSILRLFDADTFPVTQAEADKLVTAFNSFYSERGWQLQAPCPRRWYLTLAAPPAMTTTAVSQLGGQDIDAFLPRGEDAADWHRILNEVQMLFHAHPVNSAREQRGEPAINSLWFWGGGELPEVVQTEFTRVASDHPLAMGLARQAGITRVDLPSGATELFDFAAPGSSLLVTDVLESPVLYGEVERWLERLLQLEQQWFIPLLEAMRRGELTSLAIYPCNGQRFHISRRQLRAFWKPLRPFETVCQHD